MVPTFFTGHRCKIHEFNAAWHNRSTSCVLSASKKINIFKECPYTSYVVDIASPHARSSPMEGMQGPNSFSWLFFSADKPLILKDVIFCENKYFIF